MKDQNFVPLGKIAKQGAITIHHPKKLTDAATDTLYDNSVVVFEEDGVLTMPDGKQVAGKKGDKLRVFYFRHADTGKFSHAVLMKGMSVADYKERVSAHREARKKKLATAGRAGINCKGTPSNPSVGQVGYVRQGTTNVPGGNGVPPKGCNIYHDGGLGSVSTATYGAPIFAGDIINCYGGAGIGVAFYNAPAGSPGFISVDPGATVTIQQGWGLPTASTDMILDFFDTIGEGLNWLGLNVSNSLWTTYDQNNLPMYTITVDVDQWDAVDLTSFLWDDLGFYDSYYDTMFYVDGSGDVSYEENYAYNQTCTVPEWKGCALPEDLPVC